MSLLASFRWRAFNEVEPLPMRPVNVEVDEPAPSVTRGRFLLREP